MRFFPNIAVETHRQKDLITQATSSLRRPTFPAIDIAQGA